MTTSASSASLAVTTLTSGANGLFSNTHLIHAPGGTIVVDPPMLLTDARAVRDHLRTLDTPPAAVVYTHPHPDHVNGATEIIGDLDVPVYATLDTDRVSREIDAPKREFWTAIYPDDYPPVTTFATVLAKGGDTVEIAGLDFDIVDIGAGECAAGALWITGDDAFVGDLVYSTRAPLALRGPYPRLAGPARPRRAGAGGQAPVRRPRRHRRPGTARQASPLHPHLPGHGAPALGRSARPRGPGQG